MFEDLACEAAMDAHVRILPTGITLKARRPAN